MPEESQGRALWAYCVARAGVRTPSGAEPVDAAHRAEWVEADGLAALVSAVPLSEFGEAPLQRNLNDIAWLERTARAHEAVLEACLEQGTVVPLRMCTIFADRGSVERMLQEQRAAFAAALDALAGREEWAVKVLVDRAALEAAARGAESGLEVQGAQGSGTAYLGRRQVERRLREATDHLAADIAEEVHGRLSAQSVGAVLNRPQNPRLSGHEGDMVLNGAYLVDRERAGELQTLVAELGARHAGHGARLVLSGPLPPFNFATPA